ncbi:MAG TPA: butyrate kinase [Terriglobales bacterium]|nr:butyrate kinase [Terriglobales bacterium]
MPHAEYRILAINPGSTSTKFAVYLNEKPELVKVLRHSDEELAKFKGRPILEQKEFRTELIEAELRAAGFRKADFHAVVGRGGLLPPLTSGTYLVDDTMLEELRLAKRGEHASNLGAVVALSIATHAGVEAYVVDPVSVDEWQAAARISGSALIERSCLLHALNTKAVAKRYAREKARLYESLRMIVVHMGSGISVSAHENGRIIDNNTGEDGPFAADRSGSLPVQQLIKLCFSGKYTQKEMDKQVFGEGGFSSYLGTKDLMEVEKRIDAGDKKAAGVFEAMIYQVAKQIGAMASVLHGKVDAILLTGGMVHSPRVVTHLKSYIEWISPVELYPGEDELQALAEGVLRVLRHEEQPKRLQSMAAGVHV